MTTTSTAKPQGGSRGDDREIVGKVSVHIVPIVALLYIFNYMDRANIGFAQLSMSKELGISIATYGSVAAIFFIAYVVFEIPSNMVMKKVGARLWLARIAVSWGIVSVLTGFVQNTTQLYIARIALGVAEAGLYPGLLLYLTYWFRRRERGRAMSGLALAQPIALIVGSLTGGLILDHIAWFGLSGWRWVFILQGLPPILLGIWTLLRLPNGPESAQWLSTPEKSWIENALAAEDQPTNEVGAKAELRALTDPKILYLAIINLLYAVGLYGMTFFVPQIIKQLRPHYSATNIGVEGALPYICAAIAMFFVGRYSDRSGNRRGVVIATLALAVIGLIGTMTLRHHPALAIVALCLVAVGILSYLGPFWSMASEGLSRQQMAVGLAVINSIAAAGGFFGPYFIGKTAKADDVTFGLLFPVCCLVIAIVMLAFWKPARTERQASSQADAALAG